MTGAPIGRPAPRPPSSFAVPVVLWALTAVGLLAALLGDGWWDAASWVTLAVPVLVVLARAARARGGAAAASQNPHGIRSDQI